jgi:hypothetical protein
LRQAIPVLNVSDALLLPVGIGRRDGAEFAALGNLRVLAPVFVGFF